MSVEPGRKLIHYRLVEKIGEGGMGVVWKAVDTTLDREVAIKILPAAFASDAERHERFGRFEREAKLLASLNHPNIAAVYGFHEADGVRFLAMELVPGEDLFQRLARGPLPLDEALEVARSVAAALETAHEQGVIHRDLKPANVKLGPGGKVKVLDFGLAKALSPAPGSIGGDSAASPTITTAGTVAGVILGTAAYMSPEQARGREVDRRADLWAFGCLLYEMLTGRRAFDGESVTDALASVVKEEPDWSALPPATPRAVRRLLRRCLEKDPGRRLRDAGDARLELEAPGAPEPAPRTARASKLGGWRGLALGLVLGALAVSPVWFALRPAAPAREPRQLILVDTDTGIDAVAVSPDGTSVAFLGGGKIFVRKMDRLDVHEIPGANDESIPMWSPDSRWIAYPARQKLWKAPADGGAPTLLASLPGSVDWGNFGGSWGEDGRIVFTTGYSGLLAVPATGGEPTTLLEPDPETEADFHHASLLPHGRGVLFTVHPLGGSTFPLVVWDGERRKTLLEGEDFAVTSSVWVPTGHIVFSRIGTSPGIWAAPFSLAKLEVTGDPFLVEAVATAPSAAPDGSLVFASGTRGSADAGRPVWIDRQGQVVETVGSEQAGLGYLALSPDGTRVADAATDGGDYDIWIQDLARGGTTRVSSFPGFERYPRWTPDGKWITFTRVFGDASTWIKPVAGADEPRMLTEGGHASWSADGSILLYERFGGRGLWYRTADFGQGGYPVLDEPQRILDAPGDESNPTFSPDSRFVLYEDDSSGRFEVYLTRFPSGEGRWQVSVEGGSGPRWSPRGDEIFFVDPDGWLVAVPVKLGLEPDLGAPQRLFDTRLLGPFQEQGYDIAPDARRFLLPRPVDRGQRRRVVLYENWLAGR